MSLKYVSAPYGGALDKDERMKAVTLHSAKCLQNNEHIICPLTMGHSFLKTGLGFPYESDWWLKWCLKLLFCCEQMDVLMFDNWENSPGVAGEIEYAKEHGIKINYIKIEQ